MFCALLQVCLTVDNVTFPPPRNYAKPVDNKIQDWRVVAGIKQHTCKMSDLYTTDHHLHLSINCGAPSVKRPDAALVLVQPGVGGRDEGQSLAVIEQRPRGSRKFWIHQVHKLDRKPGKRLRLLKWNSGPLVRKKTFKLFV